MVKAFTKNPLPCWPREAWNNSSKPSRRKSRWIEKRGLHPRLASFQGATLSGGGAGGIGFARVLGSIAADSAQQSPLEQRNAQQETLAVRGVHPPHRHGHGFLEECAGTSSCSSADARAPKLLALP